MKKYSKGFTLIELLVVIAIIGILSSVVLASLNTARNKGSDAAVKAQLSAARPQAELYYDANNSYTGVCAAATGTKPMHDSLMIKDTTAVCYDTGGTVWAMSAKLSTSGEFWCVDNSGASLKTTAQNADGSC